MWAEVFSVLRTLTSMNTGCLHAAFILEFTNVISHPEYYLLITQCPIHVVSGVPQLLGQILSVLLMDFSWRQGGDKKWKMKIMALGQFRFLIFCCCTILKKGFRLISFVYFYSLFIFYKNIPAPIKTGNAVKNSAGNFYDVLVLSKQESRVKVVFKTENHKKRLKTGLYIFYNEWTKSIVRPCDLLTVFLSGKKYTSVKKGGENQSDFQCIKNAHFQSIRTGFTINSATVWSWVMTVQFSVLSDLFLNENIN